MAISSAFFAEAADWLALSLGSDSGRLGLSFQVGGELEEAVGAGGHLFLAVGIEALDHGPFCEAVGLVFWATEPDRTHGLRLAILQNLRVELGLKHG